MPEEKTAVERVGEEKTVGVKAWLAEEEALFNRFMKAGERFEAWLKSLSDDALVSYACRLAQAFVSPYSEYFCEGIKKAYPPTRLDRESVERSLVRLGHLEYVLDEVRHLEYVLDEARTGYYKACGKYLLYDVLDEMIERVLDAWSGAQSSRS